jgi:hypothetical protein
MKKPELKLDQISLKKVAITSRQENYKYLIPSRQANNFWVLISESYNGGDIGISKRECDCLQFIKQIKKKNFKNQGHKII